MAIKYSIPKNPPAPKNPPSMSSSTINVYFDSNTVPAATYTGGTFTITSDSSSAFTTHTNTWSDKWVTTRGSTEAAALLDLLQVLFARGDLDDFPELRHLVILYEIAVSGESILEHARRAAQDLKKMVEELEA